MEQVWPQCFVVLLKPFHPFPAALSRASPCLVGLCLKFWTLHFMSYHFSSLPKSIWKAAHLHPSVRGHLVPVTDEDIDQCQLWHWPWGWHWWLATAGFTLIPTWAFLLCKAVTVCPKPCNNKYLFLYLDLVGQSFSFFPWTAPRPTKTYYFFSPIKPF